MVFKKKSIKVKKTSNFFGNIIGTISIVIVFFIGIILVQAISNLNFNDFFSPKIDVIETTEDNKTEVNLDKINVLIVGRGGGNHDAPNLTDTIILASVDTKKSIVSMLSIPRDLYVEYPNGKSGKINEIFRKFTKIYKSEELGMDALKNKVGELTGEKVDFYVNVDFEGFVKLIDAFNGVDIEVPESFVDERYPDGKGEYTTFVLRKGTWTLDGEVALKYVRSRHSTSDFDRSIRQQQVISSLKDKIIGQGLLKNANNIKKLYNVLSEYIKTDLDLQTILKLSIFGKNTEDLKVLSFNLNDSCFYGTELCETGGFLYIPQREFFDGASVLLPNGAYKGNLSNYEELHKFTNLVFGSREIFIENHKINVFNSLKINFLASELADNIKRYGFNIPDRGSIGNTPIIYTGSVIYYNNIDEDSETLKTLKQFFSGKIEKKDKIEYAEDENTKIEIIIGEDYKEIFDF